MTVAGGSLVYGLGEDTHKRLTVLTPIDLSGAPERVAQIVETSISEPPVIRIRALEAAQGGKGYLVVAVPASPRAPHQVISGGEKNVNAYGRGATGNRVLTEGEEIADLYARRTAWGVDREHLLDAEVAAAPPLQRRSRILRRVRPPCRSGRLNG